MARTHGSRLFTGPVIAFSIATVLVIIIICEFPERQFEAIKQSFLTIGNFKLDWWHMSHLWFYMVLGCMSPGNYWKVTAIGSAFEVFEQGLGTKLSKVDERAKKQGEDYWFGRWEDVAVNSIGYLIGEWSTTGTIDLSL